jgi:hypothetical protein
LGCRDPAQSAWIAGDRACSGVRGWCSLRR